MDIAVWDTYIEREDAKVMHFDILVPNHQNNDEQSVFDFGMHYLKTKSFKTGTLTTNECRFCHIGKATEDILSEIAKNGYAILEMENCD